jgi:DNA-binding NtrC family response regulator
VTRPAPRADQPSGGGVVLLVDDDAQVRFVIRETLAIAGCQVEEAASGDQALRLLGAQTFDAIVSDIAMPGMDGVELLRRIRARDPDVPVILLTGRPRLETAVEAIEAGALRYLQKPVATAELATAVGEAVRLGRLARWRREVLEYLGGEQRLPADRVALESALDRALRLCWLAAQPIVEAASGEVFAHELLLRSDGGPLRLPAAIFDGCRRSAGRSAGWRRRCRWVG